MIISAHTMEFFSKIKRKWKTRASVVTSQRESSSERSQTPNLIDIRPQTTSILPSIPPVSGIVATETLPVTTNGAAQPPTIEAVDFHSWADAYIKFAEREPELDNDYKTHLDSIHSGDTASRPDSSRPNWARSIVDQLQKVRADKQWHVTFHGKDINFRAQAEKLLKVLILCDGIIKDALSVQPYAALAWSGVSILLPLLTSATVQHEAMLSYFDEITHVQIYWKAYQDKFPDDFCLDGDEKVRTDLVELYSYIVEYQARTICHLSSAQLSRAWQEVAGWNKWKEKASHINMLSEHCKRRMDIVHVKEIRENLRQQLEQMYESRAALQQISDVLQEDRKQRQHDLKNQRERELLTDLAADHEGYKNFNPRKVKNTCEWFLENETFRSWRDNEKSSFLWVSAGPGCGKSVLSRSLIDEWQLSTSAATSIICYFFFKDGDENRENSANAFSAILHQLLIQDLTGKFMGHALHHYEKNGKALATRFFELWDILLACATSPNAGEIVCVLDALDECKGDERNIIINKLKDFFSETGQASQRTCKLKFLITSRPYDTIERSIGSFLNSSCVRIDGDDHSAAVSEDIDRVIDARIPELMSPLSGDDYRRISDRLKGMKNRTYLWLRLTFYIIEQSPSDYSRPCDVDTLLNDLPDEHSKAYEKILNQKNTRYTIKLLQLILAARQPLSVNEARYALAFAAEEPPFQSYSRVEESLWNIDSFKSIAKNSCGLLVDFHDSKLSFTHQTVREFLTQHPRVGGELNWRGRFKLYECHSVMSLSCIRYLSLRNSESAREITRKEREDPFSYARYWYIHYREQDQDTCDNLQQEARNLCRTREGRFQDWATNHVMRRILIRRVRKWTDLALAAFFGLTQIVRAILDESVDSDTDGECYSTALSLASEEGFLAIVEMLLDTKADVNARGGHMRLTPVLAAMELGHWAVVRVLFEKRGEQIEIEEDLLRVMTYKKPEKDIMALIFKKKGKQIRFTKTLVECIFVDHNCWELMVRILEKEEVSITEGALEEAARGKLGAKIIALFVEKQRDQVQITEAVVAAAAGNMWCGREILALLLEKLGEQVQVTETVVLEAAQNLGGQEVMALLLEKRGEQVQATEAVIEAVRGGINEEAIIALFLKAGKQVGLPRRRSPSPRQRSSRRKPSRRRSPRRLYQWGDRRMS
ncbi:hypothetical protein F4679DRAFT_341114 [Xylaria curta]|nr:hypothetical protein F4679DRAFT_341114 [Xylaria curta]